MKSNFLTTWKQKVKGLKIQTFALYFAYRDPRVPWYAKAFAALVVAYAFSPIDLIPDFIPILGYADDLILIPLGVVLATKMIPAEVMAECRVKAEQELQANKPQYRYMAVVFVLIWLAAAVLVGWWVYKAVVSSR